MLRLIRLGRRQLRRRFRPGPSKRRIVLHIGAHKTGTTYIQHMMEANRSRLPLAYETVPRRQRHLHALTQMTAGAQTDVAAAELSETLTQTAAQLANRFSRVETLLITHEGLPGPLPGRKMFKGLYPQAQNLLPPIVKGLQQSGAEVVVVFYKRRFRDWQASLYHYRHIDNPERAYHPARFAERTGLPDDWTDVITRMRDPLPGVEFHVVSYEKDRASGLLGRALLTLLGLSDDQIALLRKLPPKNVSREKTRHDFQFDR